MGIILSIFYEMCLVKGYYFVHSHTDSIGNTIGVPLISVNDYLNRFLAMFKICSQL